MELKAEGRYVLLIGKLGHVEVRGIVEDLDHYEVIADASEVRCYESQNLGIVCQTTMPPDVVTDVCSQIQLHNPYGPRLIWCPGKAMSNAQRGAFEGHCIDAAARAWKCTI